MKPLCHIALCGIKHAGKTSAARALAVLLGGEAVDTDDALADRFTEKTGKSCSVRTIYAQLGEDAFRQLEAETIRNVCRSAKPCVIALGGGALSNPYVTEQDRAALGFLCCLDVPDETAFERIQREGLPPFLQKEPDPFAAFCAQNRNRRSVFARYARLTVKPAPGRSSPEELARFIFNAYQEFTHE